MFFEETISFQYPHHIPEGRGREDNLVEEFHACEMTSLVYSLMFLCVCLVPVPYIPGGVSTHPIYPRWWEYGE